MKVSKNSLTIASLLGLNYFLVVFTFAFFMGVARVLVVAPRLGPTAAVLLEVPIVIAVSWVAARYLLRNAALTLLQLAIMGVAAFILTMASEAALAALLQGDNVATWAASVATPLGLVGLAGQIIFAIMPLLVGFRRIRKSLK